mgnify:CR=1 FL=1
MAVIMKAAMQNELCREVLSAHRTVFGLDHIACLGAQHFAARILILDLAQKPVGIAAVRIYWSFSGSG